MAIPTRFRALGGLALSTLALMLVPASAAAYTEVGELRGELLAGFSSPGRVAVDSGTGHFFVADAGNNRVRVYAPAPCPGCASPLLYNPSP